MVETLNQILEKIRTPEIFCHRQQKTILGMLLHKQNILLVDLRQRRPQKIRHLHYCDLQYSRFDVEKAVEDSPPALLRCSLVGLRQRRPQKIRHLHYFDFSSRFEVEKAVEDSPPALLRCSVVGLRQGRPQKIRDLQYFLFSLFLDSMVASDVAAATAPNRP